MLKRMGIAIGAALLALGGLAGGAAVPQAEAQAGPRVDRAFLLGRWTDTDDCANNWVEFTPDGGFVTNGGARGRWTLVGNVLSFIGERTVVATVRATNRNTITLTHPDGSVGGSTRCASGRWREVPPVPTTAAAVLAMSRPFDRAFLLGRWTDTGDCNEIIQFLPDGRFIVPTGSGRWRLNGEQLSFIGGTTITARARAVGRDRILLIHQDGTIGQSLRC
ncbi:MAG: hypothetical protein QOI38_166 [Sphingomonadales bacterium]|jgi:autotransporter-associated beta strand protein|nr:hypothetical protein [Sphingomonadales bacterium]